MFLCMCVFFFFWFFFGVGKVSSQKSSYPTALCLCRPSTLFFFFFGVFFFFILWVVLFCLTLFQRGPVW